MATATPLTHPEAYTQQGQFFPHRVSFERMASANGQFVAGLVNLPCAYDAAGSGSPETFENEAPANDRILIPQWKKNITNTVIAVLTIGGKVMRFEVNDVAPDGSGPDATIVFVTPKQ